MVIESKGKVGLKRLIATHILLGLTSIFSIGLIAAASCVMLFYRVENIRKYYLWMFIPIVTVLFYYFQAPRYDFYFDLTPEQMIRDSISRDRFYILIAFIIFWLFSIWKKTTQPMNNAFVALKFLIGAFIATIGFMIMFKAGAKSQAQGFPVTSRYFIYLMPIGVMASVWACVCMNRFFASWRLAQYAFWGASLSLLVPRFLKIVPKAIATYLG